MHLIPQDRTPLGVLVGLVAGISLTLAVHPRVQQSVPPAQNPEHVPPSRRLQTTEAWKLPPDEQPAFQWPREGPRRRKLRPCAKPVPNHTGSAKLGNVAGSACSSDIEMFRRSACAQPVISDKVATHSYHTMYGLHLFPLRKAQHKVKLLEIGLGCGMNYDPGASATLWRSILPAAELWISEYNAPCVAEARRRGKLPPVGAADPEINVLVGDQSNRTTVHAWLAESGGDFDVVIDDGGHTNPMIRTSFEVLWPAVKPGGLYFLEDLQAGREPPVSPPVVSDVLQAWIDQLLFPPKSPPARKEHPSEVPNVHMAVSTLPHDLAFITCQREACVLGKACSSQKFI